MLGHRRTILQDKVLQFLQNSEDISAVAKEAAVDSKSDFSVDTVVTSLSTQAVYEGSKIANVAASFCANQCMDILKQSTSSTGLLDNEQRKRLGAVIEVMKRIQTENGFNESVFLRKIDRKKTLPVEFLWMMNEAAVFPFEVFLNSDVSNQSLWDEMAKGVVALCYKSDQLDPTFAKDIVKDVISLLISQGFSDSTSEDTKLKDGKKIASAILDKILMEMLTADGTPAFNLYEVTRRNVGLGLDLTTWKRFSSRQIQTLLTSSQGIRGQDITKEIQMKCTFGGSPKVLTSILMQLMLAFDSVEVTEQLRNFVQDQNELPWQNFLTFTSTYLVCFTDAPNFVQGIIGDLLKDAMENCNDNQLMVVFLLARQACLEGQHVFPSYGEWFHRTFGDASSPANNRKSFTFFMKFLTDIMPNESANYIQVHLLSRPVVPPKCNHLLSDYIGLANTRLADLNKPIAESGIYAEAGSDKETANQAEKDVEKALAAFEKSGKVPASIMEASIFRKPYYLGRFLPTLLKPRLRPDVPDTRMKFIEALKISEKIPQGLYTFYEKECQKEANLLVDGVLSDDEDEMNDMLLAPVDQLNKALDFLVDLVFESQSKTEKSPEIVAQISVVSEKIHNFLETVPEGEINFNRQIIVDTTTPNIDKKKIEVANLVLSRISKVLAGISCAFTNVKNSWLTQLLAKLAEHDGLIADLIAVVRKQIGSQAQSLQFYHLEALTAVLVHVISLPNIFGSIAIKKGDTIVTIEADLNDLLVCNSKESMLFSIRFCTFYLKYALVTFSKFSLHYLDNQSAVVPAILVKTFVYLVQRNISCIKLGEDSPSLCEADTSISVEQLAMKIFHSKNLKDLSMDCKITFDEWLYWESRVNPMDDPLSEDERQTYYSWAVEELFLFAEKKDGGCDGSYRTVCSKITMAIINSNTRLYKTETAQRRNCTCRKTETYSNKQALLILLQSLIHNIHCDDCGTAHPGGTDEILWSHMMLCNLQDNSDSVTGSLETSSFIRLLRLLPPWLLFMDSPHLPIDNATLQQSFRVIDSIFRNHSFATLSMEYQTCTYLLKGLNTLPSQLNSEITVLLNDCAPLPSACLVHWNLITEIKAKYKHPVLKDFFTKLQTICENPLRQTCDSYDTWQVGLAWYSLLVRPNLSEKQSLPPNFKKHPVALQSCLGVLLVEQMQLMLNNVNTEKYRNLQRLAAQIVLSGYVSVDSIGHIEVEDMFLQSVPDFIRRLIPVSTAKVLTNLTSAGLRTLLSHDTSAFLETLLTLHVKCNSLYEEGTNHSQLEANLAQHSADIQPLTIDFLRELSSFIVSVVRQLDRSVLRIVNREMLKDCDPEIQGLFS